MSLKPWREIARPHKDVLNGTFKQSEFAADITLVANGTASDDYQDAEKFFSRTFVTEGMRMLLMSVAQRLAGHGGDPVIQLQTAFGGGKTHSLLAVYHLASRKVGTEKLAGIPPILDDAGIQNLPYAKVAVIDGVKLSPSQPRQYCGTTVNTLWGELAWQLAGMEGYQLVANSDVDGTSPGKDVLIQLIREVAPCIILIDELVAFIRQMELGKTYKAGTFDSNISFIQALTESLKAVPNAILLAALPESELEAGGTTGQRALNSLEKYFARIESVWKPVGVEESFEIVRQRLFETPGDSTEVANISRQFSDFYSQNTEKFPTEIQSNEYFERLCRSYPIHPEIFDRLYEDWSTLEKFQRTRGVLQFMAVVIHYLWNSDNRDSMIMPGSLPLEKSNVLNKSIHYLPPGWQPVLEREVDGPRSKPYSIDGNHAPFGAVQAARRTARTIFLGSAPSTQQQIIRGIQAERILLGAVQPKQTIRVFEDAIKHLRDQLHYLYSDKDRYWLDTKPNLRREMESRKQKITWIDQLLPLLKQRLIQAFKPNHQFGGIHVFTPSIDVPDDYSSGPRLVVLPVNGAYSRSKFNQAYTVAEDILYNRGDRPRQNRNRLIFLAPDYDVVSRLKELGRVYLAWQSIVEDIENGVLVHDLPHFNQAKRNRDETNRLLSDMVRETYKWLIVPIVEFDKKKPTLKWEAESILSKTPSLIQSIEEKLREEEWLIYDWAPIHLDNMLKKWYFQENVDHVNALDIWRDSCCFLYLPRLVNDKVFQETIKLGVESENYFAYASDKKDDRYIGFAFGSSIVSALDESSLLIDHNSAVAYQKNKPTNGGEVSPPPNSTEDENGDSDYPSSDPPTSSDKKNFFGTVTLDPVRATMEFTTIMDEVVQQFTTKTNVKVIISVDIEASSKNCFEEDLVRTVKENCKVLGFKNTEFEEG